MQSDMHYECNYVLARLAGLPENVAYMVGNSGQFVDDNICKESPFNLEEENVLRLKDGCSIHRVATAHHPKQVAENASPDEQVRIWVPFHFYPGGQGDSIHQKLICTTDSENINSAIDHHLAMAHYSFSPYLMGITAHVYGDTFSHYGFVGIAHGINQIAPENLGVVNEAYINANWEGKETKDEGTNYIRRRLGEFMKKAQEEADRLKEEIEINFAGKALSMFGDHASLGHAFASTYPDRPYMHWSIKWEHPELRNDQLMLADRENPVTFLDGVEKIYGVFVRYRNALENARQQGGLGRWGEFAPKSELAKAASFASLKSGIDEVLKAPGAKAYRCQKWEEFAREAFVANNIPLQPNGNAIPEYAGDNWNESWKNLKAREEECDVTDLAGNHAWQFYRAASVHRNYTLRILLPDQGIVLR